MPAAHMTFRILITPMFHAIARLASTDPAFAAKVMPIVQAGNTVQLVSGVAHPSDALLDAYYEYLKV